MLTFVIAAIVLLYCAALLSAAIQFVLWLLTSLIRLAIWPIALTLVLVVALFRVVGASGYAQHHPADH